MSMRWAYTAVEREGLSAVGPTTQSQHDGLVRSRYRFTSAMVAPYSVRISRCDSFDDAVAIVREFAAALVPVDFNGNSMTEAAIPECIESIPLRRAHLTMMAGNFEAAVQCLVDHFESACPTVDVIDDESMVVYAVERLIGGHFGSRRRFIEQCERIGVYTIGDLRQRQVLLTSTSGFGERHREILDTLLAMSGSES